MELMSFWRSSCSWRVRIALAYKGVSFLSSAVHLQRDGGEQFTDEYRFLNAMCQVPTLVISESEFGVPVTIAQSLAILEYLEERFPLPPIMPEGTLNRARARQVAEVINAGIQPLQNSSTLKMVASHGIDKAQWARHWIQQGLDRLELQLSVWPHQKYLVADHPTIADFCLIPQLYNAHRFGCDASSWQRLRSVEAHCLKLEAFQVSRPELQPDAPALEG